MPYPTPPPEPAAILLPFDNEATPNSLFDPVSLSGDLSNQGNPLLAQAIVPARDGVGTQVTPRGDRYDITGGQLSGNGSNLFHSFSRFGLSQGQIANFLSNPQILNILTRITGGEASLINGRIQVTGGNSNLFLINPAGIVFGPTASLNVPASFFATTANGVGLGCGIGGVGCGGWFSATGENHYAGLNGTPNGLAFTATNPGAIANAAHLTVRQGQSLSLIGGTVITTGQLFAPEGKITLASVPGTSLVRLSQTGSLLSLEVSPLRAENGGWRDESGSAHSPVLSPPSLPELLTGGNQHNATGITVNGNGELVLTSSGTRVEASPGTTIVVGQLEVSGRRGGQVTVVGDRVGLVGATVQAFGDQGGGTIRIGGDFQGNGTIPNATRTYISPDSTLHADALRSGNGGRVIVWADKTTEFYGTITARGATSPYPSNGGFSEVSGKQNLLFRGNVDLSAPAGTPGTLLLDPVDINIVGGAGGAQDGALPVVLTGDAPATFTISQAALQSQAGNVILQATNNITVASGVSLAFVPGGSITFTTDADNDGAGSFSMDPTQTIQASGRNLTISGASLTLGNLNTSSIAAGTSTGGNVTLTGRNNVAVGNIFTAASATPPGTQTATAGSVAISAGGSITAGSITTVANTITAAGSSATGGNVSLTANGGNIVFSDITTTASTAQTSVGGNVSLIANGVVQGTTAGNTITTASPTQSGSVTIQHNGGPTNIPFVVGSPSGNGTAGAIDAGGASVITSNSFPVLPDGGTVVVGAAPNAIAITSINQPPTLTINQTLSGAVQGQPFAFTYADLAPAIADANLDQTRLLVSAINTGTLIINGVQAVPGVTLSPGDVLVFIPPPLTTGLLSSAFSLVASDGVSVSAVVPVNIDISRTSVPQGPGNPPTNPPTPSPFDPSFGNLLQQPVRTSGANDVLALTSLPCNSTDVGVNSLDDQYAQEFEEYLGKRSGVAQTKQLEACEVFDQIEAATGVKPAIVYASFVPGSVRAPETAPQAKSLPISPSLAQFRPDPLVRQNPVAQKSGTQESGDDELELIIVVPGSAPIYRRVSGATRTQVLAMARQLTTAITDPTTRETTSFLAPAQQLYQWLVSPLEPALQAKKIQNLVFILDGGLRSLPLAALHDGKGFLIERYSLGLMPSLSLTDTRYRDIKSFQVLAMGASQFKDQKPLPAVPIELSAIFKDQWSGKSFLNESFTLGNLKSQRQLQPYGIVHLATHAEFKPGKPDQSYIQLWDAKLGLDQVPQLGLNQPPVELLVLSACRTALGDAEAELGFAGLAYQAGVRSALASLWAVDDEGTLAFMTEFYQKLKTAPIKAEAVRQTQLAMLRKQIRLEQGKLITTAGTIPLPGELQVGEEDLSFPFYWAAFTLIGNQW
ncbi:CHAT domain-containing protein [Leptothermofonsia sp. ETS-13]|uniref:CHAT domain-containing protein n=1 Tax=Leptothermofonsia sp. ETS-13 TaxID=3035696 RepID=UPI003BA2CA03